MSETASWQPSASIPNLLKRAAIMAEIRRFFADRGVLEVETPCMSQATVTDIHLVPFETRFVGPGHSQGMNLWLMTSPEYHMKRLLVAGCGPVFQLCRSFRNEEMGRHHNPEFTMLEWYRPHYDMYRLMNEVDDLLQQVLDCSPAESLSTSKLSSVIWRLTRCLRIKSNCGKWRRSWISAISRILKRTGIPCCNCCLQWA